MSVDKGSALCSFIEHRDHGRHLDAHGTNACHCVVIGGKAAGIIGNPFALLRESGNVGVS